MNTVLFLGVLCITVSLSSASAHRHRKRITNGIPTSITNYPFQVSLQTSDSEIIDKFDHICGGVILNPSWVLTAAFCVTAEEDLFVLAGATNVTERNVGQFSKVIKIVVHDDYRKFDDFIINNIALLQLEVPLRLDESVEPTQLPIEYETPTGDAQLTGWGRHEQTSDTEESYPDFLYCLNNQIMDIEDCKSFYGNNSSVMIYTNLCTLSENESGSSGDQGSPLTQDGTVIGIVSWVDPCISGPLVYTKVSPYVGFINKHINEIL